MGTGTGTGGLGLATSGRSGRVVSLEGQQQQAVRAVWPSQGLLGLVCARRANSYYTLSLSAMQGSDERRRRFLGLPVPVPAATPSPSDSPPPLRASQENISYRFFMGRSPSGESLVSSSASSSLSSSTTGEGHSSPFLNSRTSPMRMDHRIAEIKGSPIDRYIEKQIH